MQGIRVKLDLSNFLQDVGRHRVMFLPRDQISTVSDLEEKIRSEYLECEKDDNINLFLEGTEFLLPSWESINVLCKDDLVKVTLTKRQEVGRKRKHCEINTRCLETVSQVSESAKKKRWENKNAYTSGTSKASNNNGTNDNAVNTVPHRNSTDSDSELEEERPKTTSVSSKGITPLRPVTAKVSTGKESDTSTDSDSESEEERPKATSVSDSDSSDSNSNGSKPLQSVPKPVTVKVSTGKESDTSTDSDSESEEERPKATSVSDSDSSDSNSKGSKPLQPVPKPVSKPVPKPVTAKVSTEKDYGTSTDSDSESTDSNSEINDVQPKSVPASSTSVLKQLVKAKVKQDDTSSCDSSPDTDSGEERNGSVPAKKGTKDLKLSDSKINVPPIKKALAEGDSRYQSGSSQKELTTKSISPPELNNTSVENGKKKRKRKRKHKNKNKLPADQIYSFSDSSAVNYNVSSEVAAKKPLQKNTHNGSQCNSRKVFPGAGDEVEESNGIMDVEEWSVEDIQRLYKQSVAVCTPKGGVSSSKNGSDTRLQDSETTLPCKEPRKQPSRIAFSPRALNIQELRREKPVKLSPGPSDQMPVNTDRNVKPDGKMKAVGHGESQEAQDSYVNQTPKDYSSYHAVSSGGPRVNDIIAFKMIEMSENYTPELSDFKEGRVITIDENNLVTFLLANQTKKKRLGKFELNYGEPDSPDHAEEAINLRWSEVIDPRLVFP